MSKVTFPTPELYAEHHPDTSRTVNADKTITEEELPGFITVGVVLGGVHKELYRFKAGGFLADLKRHQEAQPVVEQTQPPDE